MGQYIVSILHQLSWPVGDIVKLLFLQLQLIHILEMAMLWLHELAFHFRILNLSVSTQLVYMMQDVSLPKVASAAYGDDHTTTIDILERKRYANGLVVSIILRPFDFEGRRRQDEEDS